MTDQEPQRPHLVLTPAQVEAERRLLSLDPKTLKVVHANLVAKARAIDEYLRPRVERGIVSSASEHMAKGAINALLSFAADTEALIGKIEAARGVVRP